MDEYWTCSQAAETLGVHRTTVLRWVEDGFLPARIYRRGDSRPTIRIPRAAVEALARHADPPVEPPDPEPGRG